MNLLLVFLVSLNICFANYERPLLIARAGENDSYNLPKRSYFFNTAGTINNNRDLYLKLSTISGKDRRALIYFNYKDTNNIVTRPVFLANKDRHLTDMGINNSGHGLFIQQKVGAVDGLYFFNKDKFKVTNFVSPVLNKEMFIYSTPIVSDSKLILLRGVDRNSSREVFLFRNMKWKSVIKEGKNTGLSFIFYPSMNNLGVIASKVTLGPINDFPPKLKDEIRLYFPSGRYFTIAKDKDADIKSPFHKLENSVSINNKSQVLVTAILANKKRAMVLVTKSGKKIILKEGEAGISKILSFTPQLNNKGDIAFRAISNKGKMGVYIIQDNNMHLLAQEGMQVQTDKGIFTISLSKNGLLPVFAGGTSLNDLGDVSYHAMIEKNGVKEQAILVSILK